MSTNAKTRDGGKEIEIVRREPASVTVVFRLTPGEKAQLHGFAREHDCTTSDVLYTALALIRAIEPDGGRNANMDFGPKDSTTKQQPAVHSWKTAKG